jgi:hypothetical protein
MLDDLRTSMLPPLPLDRIVRGDNLSNDKINCRILRYFRLRQRLMIVSVAEDDIMMKVGVVDKN